ncbi:site-specific DNA-methyltransferase, partial [Macellibacteroides fermentans]|uniref:site-specific DNA-methyltransferase n=1 Tax=Macellibacteroides fermentans TaxID=879969 RepID=UPI00406C94D6
KMKFETPNLTNENKAKIAALFPGVVADGKVNIDLLRSMLGEDVFADEAYEFTWVGKRAAIAEAGKPIRKTLRPCPEESKNWDTTENLYIEGDNLEVLKLLQESYLGKVKMIYIDPPYNTGNDFVYRDKFTKSLEEFEEETGVYDETGDRLIKNTESNGRFHSDWCSMIFPRLVLSRNLLRDDGVIFVSIDDNEQSTAVKLLDEVFGAANKIGEFVVIRAEGGGLAKQVIKGHDYLFAYARNIASFTPLGRPKDIRGKIVEFKGEKYWVQEDWLRKEFGKYGNCHYEEILEYKGFAVKQEIDDKLDKGEYILIPKANGMNIVGKLRNIKEDASKFYSILKHLSANGVKDLQELDLAGYFDYPKPVSLLNELILGATFFTSQDGDIILDFFSGSATTAHAVMKLNAEDSGTRKFIMVQLPEVIEEDTKASKAGFSTICDIGKERIRRAGKHIIEEAGLSDNALDVGFRVLKLDDTNMNDVYYAAGDYTQNMISMLESNIKEDRTDMDLLFGCLLDWGLPLSLPHTHEKIEGFTVHTYNEGDLIACFEERISEHVVREIAKRQPLRVVFRDSSFTSSPEKINVVEIFKLLAPNTTVRVI